jgi:CheY-like chemotaxis protein
MTRRGKEAGAMAQEALQDAAATPSPQHEVEASRPRCLGRILVVEDDLAVARMYAARLRAKGYDVVTATSARDALQLAKELRPDLIMLDLMLPDRSGYEVARDLRTMEDTRAVPVIMVCGSVKLRAGEARAAGIECVLYKPVSPAILVQKVEKALAGRAGAAAHA